ncbi:MAG: hypothetical protein HZB56_19230 [Deltaproteobacteria bacterium]|nr:hypothetical protein [Deltaproteobacteria bacterium]
MEKVGSDGRKVILDAKTGRFVKGNPGRPKGSKNKATIAVENMMEGEAETITRKCIDLALGGDTVAIKLVLDRVAPVRKGRALQGLARREGEHSVETLLRAVLEGDITPEEGKDVITIIEGAAQAAAARALATMRQQQLDAFNRMSESGLGRNVMLVPVTTQDDWADLAATQQRQLKAKVKE